MYETHAEIDSNCLFVTMGGRPTRKDAEALVYAFLLEARKLRPGFTVVNDLSEASPASDDVVEVIRLGQRGLHDAGAARVIRVVGEAAPIGQQFTRTQQEANVGYEVIVVETREEALRLARVPVMPTDVLRA